MDLLDEYHCACGRSLSVYVDRMKRAESRVAELEAENQNLRMLHDADAAAIGQMARKALKN